MVKAIRGEHWRAAFANHIRTDPVTEEEVRKQIMLERFQAENPGFDFSGAEFSGAVPDAASFLGGVRH